MIYKYGNDSASLHRLMTIKVTTEVTSEVKSEVKYEVKSEVKSEVTSEVRLPFLKNCQNFRIFFIASKIILP